MRTLIVLICLYSFPLFSQSAKKCFKKCVSVEQSSDVKNVNCYLDEDDLSFQISFNCNDETWERIVEHYNLNSISNDSYSDGHLPIWEEYEWWNHDTLKKIEIKYVTPRKGTGGYYTHFWHDEEDSIVYVGRIIL